MATMTRYLLFGVLVALFGVSSTNAVQIGYGPGIGGSLDSAGNRLNVDQTYTTLAPGLYSVTDFTFNTGSTAGTATPLLSRSTGSNAYATLWVGPDYLTSAGSPGVKTDVYSGGSQVFYLPFATNVYAGFAQINPVVTFVDPGPTGNTDHDNSFTTPTGPGQAVSGFSNANLPRNYAFAMDVSDPGPTNTVNARITADNQYQLYVSLDDSLLGTPIGSDGTWENYEDYSFEVPHGTTVYLHVVGTDTGGQAGFIGQFDVEGAQFLETGSDLLYTNTTDWGASETGFGGPYVTPSVDYGAYGTSPWFTTPGAGAFDVPDARWIWHNDLSGAEVRYFSAAITAVPEPSTTAMLLGLGGMGLWTLVRRRRTR